MKVLVTGDRFWSDCERILEELERLPKDTIVVHGACLGADFIAGEIVKQLGMTVRSYPADWDRFGRAAGPIRNRAMFKAEHRPEEPIDLCLAFHNDIASSRGTKDMVSVVSAAGVPLELKSSHVRSDSSDE